jgi:Fe-S cluster assembly iron-binding protein IscA
MWKDNLSNVLITYSSFRVTQAAQDVLTRAIREDGSDDLALRIYYGPPFRAFFVNKVNHEDIKFIQPSGIMIVVDPISLPYIKGLDYDDQFLEFVILTS